MIPAARALLAAAGLAAAALPPPGAAVARDELAITVHHGYGSAAAFVLEGRVAERRDEGRAGPADSWARNLWRSLRRLVTDEAEGVPLRATFAGRTFAAVSDEEGYFAVRDATPGGARPGWNPVRLEAAGGAARAEAELLIVPAENALGIISDVDDTVVVSEVADRSRLAAHLLLENHLQREPVAGMAALYRATVARNPRPEAAAVVYLTASPRQLVPSIRAFLAHNGFPRGAIVAKRVSGDGRDPLLDQERYKTERIERLLADLPGVRFVLAGDDGERDPEVYRAIAARFPARVEAVWIRPVSPDPSRPAHPGQGPPPAAPPAP